ncbi:MAG: DUF4124 domain-containing protein [Rudaea sp.]
MLILAMCSAAATSFAASGQVYKWTDAQGVVHYSDAPPPMTQQNVQTVRVSGGDRPRAVDTDSTPSPENKPIDSSTAETPSTQVANTNDHSKDCANARSNLELLQSKFPVSVAGTDGKPMPLDDKARQAQVADMNARIALYCK